jgi:catechol 2,3-dioxygenase-like lactoylglutathione lyase family enzyme
MNRRAFVAQSALAGAASALPAAAMNESNSPAQAIMQIRVARPTDKLTEVVAFYRDGLGLPTIGQFENHDGYSGVMLGSPSDQFHLEFTHTAAGSPCPAPTRDNLLVFYISDDAAYAKAVKRMKEHGYQPVQPENPYWRDKSFTFEDPDGWRTVICHGQAFANR